MSEQHVNEIALLIPRDGVPYDEPDRRPSYQRQLALYSILGSTALERLAFYSLVINLIVNLQTSELSWGTTSSVNASSIFFGKYI